MVVVVLVVGEKERGKFLSASSALFIALLYLLA